MSGPLPYRTALKAARGYPSHHKKNPAEPTAARLTDLTPPPYLPPVAVVIWQELAPIADQVGVLDQLGARAFATACRLQALGEAHLSVAEAQFKPGSRPGPSLWAGVKCLEKAATIWSRFGLDPASRTRLRVGGTEGESDELASFRRAYPRRQRQQAE
jgi:phage terminase small subunit